VEYRQNGKDGRLHMAGMVPGDTRAPSSQHALGVGGPLSFRAVLTGRGSDQRQEKTAWTEGDGCLGK
jgi:hypothetical protein